MNNGFTTVLIDADDTLLDFHKAEKQALKTTLSEINIEWTEELNEIYLEENLKIWKEYEKNEITRDELKVQRFERFFKRASLIPDLSYGEINNIYIENLSQCGYMLEGAMDFVKSLKRYANVYIATNGLAFTQRGRLKASGLDNIVDGAFISEEINFNKPSKDYFDYIFSQLGITDKSSVIIIGDSLTSDMQGGKNAGITTCFYSPNKDIQNQPLCDYIAHSYDDILKLFKDL